MGSPKWISLFFLASALLFSLSLTRAQPDLLLPVGNTTCSCGDAPQIYIVHVQQPEGTHFLQDREAWHTSFLPSSALDSGEPRLVYSYTHAISGFAARLTPQEAKAMGAMDGFLQAFPARSLKPRTTHSPAFLGLEPGKGMWQLTNYGKGAIIGMLDFGAYYPTHPSFSDNGMTDAPPRWKGSCFDPSFCNKKIIGAIGFNNGKPDSPLDTNGHGTQTASVAAGNFVAGANVVGNALGTASGIAPLAHLAIYKVCFDNVCREADILAGIDRAIKDRVDVLSMSLGEPAKDFYQDVAAIGSFAAMENGIFFSAAAGNDGPTRGSVENDAPWMLTVGASTVDRSLRATVRLGNGDAFNGESAYQPADFPSALLPLVYPGAKQDPAAMACKVGSLGGIDVTGKVVMCHTGGGISPINKGIVVKNAGGAAMILMNQEPQQYTVIARSHVLPASHISYADSMKVLAYFRTTSKPTAGIVFGGTLLRIPSSPMVGSLSGRGPSKINGGGILKPDIIGPGVSILGASIPSKQFPFDMSTGTSIANPHLAGIAAMLKVSHPYWSPAAIKSAIMTSSDVLNHDGKPIADETSNPASFFAMGAGHANPQRANNPGIVYDLQAVDYIPYLCGGLKYTDGQVSAIVRRPIKCSDFTPITAEQLNYPSFALSLQVGTYKIIKRTATNVGEGPAVYVPKITAQKGLLTVTVDPDILKFSKPNQKVSFQVRFSADPSAPKGSVSEGQLVWVNKQNTVRSPISVTFA